MKTTGRRFLATLLVATAAWGAAVIIRTAPPAPVSMAVVGVAPSPRHIWIPGYYKGVNGRYVWVHGRWRIPPHPGQVWVAPMWRSGPNGYTFVTGHWR